MPILRCLSFLTILPAPPQRRRKWQHCPPLPCLASIPPWHLLAAEMGALPGMSPSPHAQQNDTVLDRNTARHISQRTSPNNAPNFSLLSRGTMDGRQEALPWTSSRAGTIGVVDRMGGRKGRALGTQEWSGARGAGRSVDNAIGCRCVLRTRCGVWSRWRRH